MNEDFDPQQVTESFFKSYTRALLKRDAAAVAAHYAVPGLIEFPDAVIPVAHRDQTERFFKEAFSQYLNVTHADPAITIAACGVHSIWADVRWDHHGGAPDERNMYQLTYHEGSWRIATLTPLDL